MRQWLRRTKVNRDIEQSIRQQAEHKYFPAFHNGLTVLCKNLVLKGDKITISGSAVVNGCQSLTGLYENRKQLSSDLRILTKLIRVSPETPLAMKITDHTTIKTVQLHVIFSQIIRFELAFKQKSIPVANIITASNEANIQTGM